MSSTAKALSLLKHFSTTLPEIGLSQLCRMAGRDKATTYRYLQALEIEGFVEQNPATKQYRLGPAVIQMAQVREATVPRKSSAMSVLTALVEATGETAHVTVLSGTALYGLCECESQRHGTRAVIDNSVFPLHATGSGLCVLAYSGDDLLKVATKNMEAFTKSTPTTEAELVDLIAATKASGFGIGDQSFEDEIKGIAAPLFDHTGHLAGALSVASVAARFTPDLERTIKAELITAARQITRNWGGAVPAAVEAAWATSVNQSTELDTTT
ncbi:IclR family transcriptional regulator [Cognatishimia sp.]|uniref:IclR family transcriptional regulator n=1 Tax=Cognatishimia sp. TaxID=2211648 RepID=UPI003517C72F